MSMNSFQQRPSSAAQRPLPQNRQAFGTVSQAPRPGVNSAQPMAYQGGVKQGVWQSGQQQQPDYKGMGLGSTLQQRHQTFQQNQGGPYGLPTGGMQGGVQPGISALPQFGQQQGFQQQPQFGQQQQQGFQQPQAFQGMSGTPIQQTPGMQYYWGRQQARYGLSGNRGGGAGNWNPTNADNLFDEARNRENRAKQINQMGGGISLFQQPTGISPLPGQQPQRPQQGGFIPMQMANQFSR